MSDTKPSLKEQVQSKLEEARSNFEAAKAAFNATVKQISELEEKKRSLVHSMSECSGAFKSLSALLEEEAAPKEDEAPSDDSSATDAA